MTGVDDEGVNVREGDDPRVVGLVNAWMAHQGYTAEDIALAEAQTCANSGCEFESGIGYYQHTDEDEVSLHVMADILAEAGEFAMFAVEHFRAAGFGDVAGVKAAAWDEGHKVGTAYGMDNFSPNQDPSDWDESANPYRTTDTKASAE